MIPNTFSKDLLKWYQKSKRDLPWRHTQDPYHIWVSEMMLQQTTVSTVIAFYTKWLQKFPTIHDLAQAPLQEVLACWQGLGYYNRARNLHKAAQIVVDQYKGVLPKDPLLVKALPGFGPYSTGSVLSIAYNIPLTIVDANVRRVFMRLLNIDAIADAKQDKHISAVLEPLLPKNRVGDFNQSLMELGALICKPRNPSCNMCPVSEYCQAYKAGKQELIPQTTKKNIQEIHAAIGIIEQKGKYFIQQRPATGLLAGMWEFPGGKINPGETAEQAVKRELCEELAVVVNKASYLCKVSHFYTQFKVNLSVWLCTCESLPKSDKMHRWVKLNEFKDYPMPSGSAKIVDFLKKR